MYQPDNSPDSLDYETFQNVVIPHEINYHVGQDDQDQYFQQL